MTSKSNRLKRVGAGVAVLAAVASVGVFGNNAQALPPAANPATPPTNGTAGLTLSAQSGTRSSFFSLGLTDAGSQTCPADSVSGFPGTANENFRAAPFITPITTDPSQLDFDNPTFGGGFPDNGAGTALGFFNAGGPVSPSSPAAPNGNIVLGDFANLTFAGSFGGLLTAGEYFIGIACYDQDTFAGVPANATQKFWATTLTISSVTATTFNWRVGTVPAAAGVTGSGTNGSANLTLTAPAARTSSTTPSYSIQPPPTPVVSGYSIEAQPVGASGSTGLVGPFTQASAGSYFFPAASLTNGTQYNVRVTATNSVGNGPTTTVQLTPNIVGFPAVTGLQSTPGPSNCSVTFAAAANVPLSYRVNVTTVAAFGSAGAVEVSGSPIAVAADRLTLPLTVGGTAGVQLFVSVTGLYNSPAFGITAQTTCIPASNALIVQQVSVVRPPGALILTQRCGVFGELPQDVNTNTFPGFPRNFGAATGTPAAGIDTGGAPNLAPLTIDRDGPTNNLGAPTTLGAFDPRTNPDTAYGAYPNPSPATYRTYCGLELGRAALETEGDLAGFYYASGRLNEVSVLDSRDSNLGWEVTATMRQFSDGAASNPEVFSGSYLGIKPRISNVAGPLDTRGTGEGIGFTVDTSNALADNAPLSLRGVTAANTQIVVAGAEVNSGTGVVTGDITAAGTGLGNGELLARARAGYGLGVAEIDASVELLIPSSANAGTYVGELELSVLSL